MKTQRVLIVDDDRALLMALTAALRLRMSELTVETSDSGARALERVRNTDYDAVVSDIKMPGMDGLSLLREIRQIDPDLPTLLITGHGQHDLAVQALRGGAFDFIQKPIDRNYLVAALDRAIQMRRLRRQVECQQRTLEQHAAELEQAVAERTRELRHAGQAKDLFLAMLSHELRNPLACIRYAVDLMSLARTQGSEEDEVLDAVSRQVSHMTHLLDDLLDVSRISQDRVTLNREPVNLTGVVRHAVRSLGPLLQELRHEATLETPEEPLWVSGDRTRLEQVVMNLLNNAAKYTNPGGTIKVTLHGEEDRGLIRVQDNGIGIASEMLPRVFELFSQADRSLDRSRGGLGIGLTLVQKLVELHDGWVEVSSTEGVGSTFTVGLPLVGAGVDEDEELPLLQPSAVAGHRVLLVEDNAAIAKVTRMLLQNRGHQVVAVVSNGPAAIDAARVHQPDYVFLDIGLPQMDGYEVARRIRQIAKLKGVKLVALTGYGQDEDRRRSREVGFDHHLVKPVSVKTIDEVFAALQPVPVAD